MAGTVTETADLTEHVQRLRFIVVADAVGLLSPHPVSTVIEGRLLKLVTRPGGTASVSPSASVSSTTSASPSASAPSELRLS